MSSDVAQTLYIQADDSIKHCPILISSPSALIGGGGENSNITLKADCLHKGSQITAKQYPVVPLSWYPW